MISIIVCSIDEFLFKRFNDSLSRTIGLPFEIIRYENHVENLSIGKVYNKCASQASFDFLVFVHEDVIFHNLDWGIKLVTHFEKLQNPGVLGFAGSNYLPLSPTDWWIGDSKHRFFNYLENSHFGKENYTVHRSSGDQNSVPVYLLDGMFLALKREIYEQIKFDESLEGFHGYDISISLRSSERYQNYFIPDILIEHLSRGHPNSFWIENLVKSYCQIEHLSFFDNRDFKLEEKSFHLFLNHLKKLAPNWGFQVKQSFIYLMKLQKNFFSFRVYFLWFWYQIMFLITEKST